MARVEKAEKSVYKFKSIYKNVFFFKGNIQFKDYLYQTTDEKEAEYLRSKDGVTEIKEEVKE